MINHLLVSHRVCVVSIFFFIMSISCGGRNQSKQEQAGCEGFTLPTIPFVITNPVERADYLGMHYWDNVDFTCTSLIQKPEILEQAFVNYLEILPHLSEASLFSSIGNTLAKAMVVEEMLTYITDLFEKYLYDPNAPWLNEEVYSIVLEYLIASPQVDDLNKIRPLFQMEQINKNRQGTIASDFVYTLSNGKQESMHKIKADFLVLFFNNPGCSACSEYQQGLDYSPVVTQLINEGRLKILAMYVDEDITAWRAYAPSIPQMWINGYDASTAIRNEKKYDLRAIPSLYLLDKEKRVILKDVYTNQIEEWLVYTIQNAQ